MKDVDKGSEYCGKCRYDSEHPTCSLTIGCPCCDDTIMTMIEQGDT